MAVRGFVTLLFILMSGIVHANDLVMAPLPETAYLRPRPNMQTTAAFDFAPGPTTSTETTTTTTETPTTSTTTTTEATTTTTTTTEAPTTTTTTTTTTEAPTTTTTTTTTTEAPTTTTTTTTTTEAPTTTTTTTTTTEAPTTTTTTTTTEAPTTTTTTKAPTTTTTTEAPTTTHHNSTNSTTEAPTTAHTNATTVPTPTTTPTVPPVPNPTVGNYSVMSDNVTVCLLAKMGLQFSFKMSGNPSLQTLNLDPNPNVTEASGTCAGGGNESSLVLKSKEVTVHFVFTNVSDRFSLRALNLSVDFGNGSTFNDFSNNLSLWEASVGSSYMCKKELSYNITDKLTVNTFELQVQPFAVQKNMFSTAHECSMDDTSLLIPIIVGAALAGLIVIVVIAYVIGRRRTYVGYQTL